MLRPSLAALGLAALVGIAPSGPSFANSRVPFALEVENATAKVGEPTAVRATVAPPEGMKLSSAYRHRLIDLSVFEDRGVEFDDEVVIGAVQDDGSLRVRGRPHPDRARRASDQRPDARAVHQRQQVRIEVDSLDRQGDRDRVSRRSAGPILRAGIFGFAPKLPSAPTMVH